MAETTGWKLGDLADDPFSNIPGDPGDDLYVDSRQPPTESPSLANITTLDDLAPLRFDAEKRWFKAVHSFSPESTTAVEREIERIYERAVELAEPCSLTWFAAVDALAHWRSSVARSERIVRDAA